MNSQELHDLKQMITYGVYQLKRIADYFEVIADLQLHSIDNAARDAAAELDLLDGRDLDMRDV